MLKLLKVDMTYDFAPEKYMNIRAGNVIFKNITNSCIIKYFIIMNENVIHIMYLTFF
jgi:hypothetical protein